MDSLPAGKISTDWGSAAPGFIFNFLYELFMLDAFEA